MQFTRGQLLVAVVSLLYLGATAFLLYAAVAIGGTLSRAKWTELFEVVTASSSDHFLVYSIVCTSVAVLASCFRRILPAANNWVMTFACMFVVFASVLAAMGFRSAAAARDWTAAPYPFNVEEANVANTFHEAYCPTVACAYPIKLSPTATNATISICSSGRKPNPATAAIFDWVQTYCTMSSDTDAFCVRQLFGNTTNVTAKSFAPYQRCRLTLFGTWSGYANNVAAGSTALALSALVFIFVMSRPTRPRPVVARTRSRKKDDAYVAAV